MIRYRQTIFYCFVFLASIGTLQSTCTMAFENEMVRDANKQPNFIIIFCDDLGYADIGPFGSTHHRTPNIDRMANEGLRLTNFYSTCGVCTPSRSSLMTGCYPKRVGLHESASGGWVLFPGGRRGINEQETTMAELLKSAGYATAIFGKWHLGDQPPFLPTRHGFDQYFGIPYSNDMGDTDRPIQHRYPPTPLLENETVLEMEPDQRFLTRRYTEKALGFIEHNKDRPFFLYLPHSMPHWPQYSSEKFSGKSANGAWGDAVEEIDWSTGVIFEKLKKLGIDDNTLVVFTSDNGGAKQHGASNLPLRGGKGSTWEGGHRVCCVVRWPGNIQSGSVSNELTVTFDLLPTFAKLAGARKTGNLAIDGKDIGPVLLEQAKSPHEAYFYYFRGNLNAVRMGEWKLFVKRGKKPELLAIPELYNLSDDVGETKNVASQNPKVVARLQNQIEIMRADLGDGPDHKGAGTRKAGHVDQPETLTQIPVDEIARATVFESGIGGYHTYRIPSLIVTPKGHLLAVCEGRKTGQGDQGDLDLIARRSLDMGKTWEPQQLVYEEGGDKKVTIGNPCPVVDKSTGRIWLPFCRNNSDVLVTYSDDDGESWSTPIDISKTAKEKDWGWYATGPGVGIQMTKGKYNGRLIIPCDHREKENGKWIKKSNVFFSDDHGATWLVGGTVANHTDECQLVELNDGRLMINMRNYWGTEGGKRELGFKRCTSISDDGGKTWGELSFDETLTEPICQASFLRHNSDKSRVSPLLFSNPASASGRHHLTVRVSMDGAKTWPYSRLICEGPSVYSCLTVLSDRSIGCLYETGDKRPYERLVFARFTLPWINRKIK